MASQDGSTVAARQGAARGERASLRRLCQKDLARRWGLSTRTLERWRMEGRGPAFMKLGGRVIYRAEDIEAFELERLHQSTAEALAGDGA
jgi:hypothetical protein